MNHCPPSQTNATMLEHIVQTALLRSFGSIPSTIVHENSIIVLIGKQSSCSATSSFKGKALVFGMPTPSMFSALGLQERPFPPAFKGSDACHSAEGTVPFTQSAASLAYSSHPLNTLLTPALLQRPFTRFDYTDEWNNLGFGRIRTDKSLWAVCAEAIPDQAKELAGIFLNSPEAHNATYCGAYMTLHDTLEASVLWCARPVGPVDSTEWTVIEQFVSDWRSDSMPCLPCLCQTPAGCQCLVTMRLDCDEAIQSASALFEWYKNAGVPFSLAVKTCLPIEQADMALLAQVRASGGGLLSHTHTHQVNWGASGEEALADAQASFRWFAENQPGMKATDLAVSPFHTNPPYAVQAMEQAGFTGFVSGIIHNDPEYLMGRAGKVPFALQRMVSISQQSMFHGDCYKRQENSIAVHLAAFAMQYKARGIFGYLDHPFSPRYQYDWQSEQERLEAHTKLVSAMQQYDNVWFWNQEQCFAFVKALASTTLVVSPCGTVTHQHGPTNDFSLVYRYKGKEYIMS